MKKLSKLSESIWSDIQDRSAGEDMRKEDGKIVLKLEIDNVTYKFTDLFMSMGEEYNEENSDNWKCFAFNKPDNGSTLIHGNTEDIGAFGESSYDVEDSPKNEGIYDVYVLREFIEKSKEELIEDMLKEVSFSGIPHKPIQDIIRKYVTKIFDEGHMSEYAYYTLFDVDGSDFNKGTAIWYYRDDDPTDMDVCDEFEDYNIEYVDSFTYADWDWWRDDLEKELTEEYEKMGYVKAESDGIDPYGGCPQETAGLVFVKLGDERDEEDDEDDEDDEDIEPF